MQNELMNCWEQYGVDHPKCVHLKPKFDAGMVLERETRAKYRAQVKQYPAIFQGLLVPEMNRMYFKGKYSQGYWLTNETYRMPKY